MNLSGWKMKVKWEQFVDQTKVKAVAYPYGRGVRWSGRLLIKHARSSSCCATCSVPQTWLALVLSDLREARVRVDLILDVCTSCIGRIRYLI